MESTRHKHAASVLLRYRIPTLTRIGGQFSRRSPGKKYIEIICHLYGMYRWEPSTISAEDITKRGFQPMESFNDQEYCR